MIKTARRLKDLIRNLSREKSADAQILMRNYMMERFLERISLSEYKDKFILKGGMLVAAMVGLDARSTMDLDATARKRGTEKYLPDALAVCDEVENSPAMLKLWSAYQKKFSYAADTLWDTVMESVRNLYRIYQGQ